MPKTLVRARDLEAVEHQLSADVQVAISPGIQQVHAVQLPLPGAYQVDMLTAYDTTAGGASRTLTLGLRFAGVYGRNIQMNMNAFGFRHGTVPTLFAVVVLNGSGTAAVAGTAMTASFNRGTIYTTGRLLVSAPCEFIVQANATVVSPEVATIKAGSFVRAIYQRT